MERLKQSRKNERKAPVDSIARDGRKTWSFFIILFTFKVKKFERMETVSSFCLLLTID
jgi:hypothetical protein